LEELGLPADYEIKIWYKKKNGILAVLNQKRVEV
jgi:hypothetical protein